MCHININQKIGNRNYFNYKQNRSKINRNQIVSTEDLKEFKTELLSEIEKLLNQQNGSTSKKWLKSNEVRELLKISPGTLQNLRVNGTLPYTKIGGTIFYDSNDIQAMLKENRCMQV